MERRMESILTSVKEMLLITEECKDFDVQIIMHINSVLMVLTQLGVGPKEGYAIEDDRDEWGDFLCEHAFLIESVKSYVYMKVKLIFDPPLNSSVLESMKQLISELEWRIQVAVDSEDSNRC